MFLPHINLLLFKWSCHFRWCQNIYNSAKWDVLYISMYTRPSSPEARINQFLVWDNSRVMSFEPFGVSMMMMMMMSYAASNMIWNIIQILDLSARQFRMLLDIPNSNWCTNRGWDWCSDPRWLIVIDEFINNNKIHLFEKQLTFPTWIFSS